jgi:hypothetical protein
MALLSGSLGKLSNRATPLDYERLAVLLHDVMSARWRSYHTTAHLFDVCSRLKDPIEVLAALGHDLVYVQVDRRIHPRLEPELAEFTLIEDFKITRVNPSSGPEPWLPSLFEIFGIDPSQRINPLGGGNELLSAIAWCRLLQPWLNTEQILEIAICIEGTIPFRPVAGPSDSPHLRLRQRLQDRLPSLDWNPLIARSVRLAHSDIYGFGFQPLGDFLDNTWLLILEGNPIFKNPVYNARQYREALGRIDGFFRNLKAESVFSHDGSPGSVRIYNRSIEGARRNLQQGAEYVEAKMLALSFFEALGLATGGEGPLLLFFGAPLHVKGRTRFPIEGLLRWKGTRKAPKKDPILKLLSQGRSEGGEGFDISRSPVAAELRARLSSKEFQELTQARLRFEKGELGPEEYLRLFPKELSRTILEAVVRIAESRKAELLRLSKTLSAG